jgi:hypothetical protein
LGLFTLRELWHCVTHVHCHPLAGLCSASVG